MAGGFGKYNNQVTIPSSGAGSGDVTGPASSTDNAVARWDGTTGELLQNSVVTISDAGVMSGATQLNVDNLRMDGNTISSTGGIVTLTASTTVGVSDNKLRVTQSSSGESRDLSFDLTPLNQNLILTPIDSPAYTIGDTQGPASSTDNELVRFHSTTGKVVQSGGLAILSDAGALSAVTQLDVDNIRVDGNTISSTDTNGNVVVDPNGSGTLLVTANAASPQAPTTGTLVHFVQADETGTRLLLDAYGAVQGNMTYRHARGTAGSPTASQANDLMGLFGVIGRGATGYSAGAKATIGLIATENWTDSAQGAAIAFSTTADGSTTLAERVRVTQSGDLNAKVSLTVGTSGTATPITQIRVYTPNINPASLAAQSTAEETFTVTGLTTADKVFVVKPTHTANFGVVNARVSAADTLALTFMNPSTLAASNPGDEVWTVVAFRS